MEFLPLWSDGQWVYAGFWKRLLAVLVDALILMPVGYLFVWIKGFGPTLAIAVTIPSSILFAMYHVLFNARLGGTPGKLAVGIRITRPDGSRIGWPEAWKRSAVDLVFAAIGLTVEVWVLAQVDPGSYASLGFSKAARLVHEHAPAWYGSLLVLQGIWIWSELVVLLLNHRKRAIHDFIAGTVVIQKAFAKPEGAVACK